MSPSTPTQTGTIRLIAQSSPHASGKVSVAGAKSSVVLCTADKNSPICEIDQEYRFHGNLTLKLVSPDLADDEQGAGPTVTRLYMPIDSDYMPLSSFEANGRSAPLPGGQNVSVKLMSVDVELSTVTVPGTITVQTIPAAAGTEVKSYPEGMGWEITTTAVFVGSLTITFPTGDAGAACPNIKVYKRSAAGFKACTLSVDCVIGQAVCKAPGFSEFFLLTAADGSALPDTDEVDPVTGVSIQGDFFKAPAGPLYASPNSVIGFAGADAFAGLDATYYKENPSAELLAGGLSDATISSFTLFSNVFAKFEGDYIYAYGSRDRAGNYEVLRATTVAVDGTSPDAALYIDDTPITGATAEADDSQSLSFTASDPDISNSTYPGSGVANTFYLVDLTLEDCGFTPGQSPPVQPAEPAGTCANPVYSDAPFTLPAGTHTVRFFASDNVGNVSATREVFIDVDYAETTPPETTLSFSTNLLVHYNEEGRVFLPGEHNVALSPADTGAPVASGVDAAYYTVNPSTSLLAAGLTGATTGQFVLYSGTFTLAEGEQIIAYGSVDNAGNYETLQTTTVYVDGAPPVSSITVLGAYELIGSTYQFTQGSSISITGIDPVSNGVASGLSEIFFLVNETEESCGWGQTEPEPDPAFPQGSCENPVIEQPYALPPGEHVLRFSAIDNVENEEDEQLVYVRVLPAAPPAIADLSAANTSLAKRVNISWTPPAGAAETYAVQHATSPGAAWDPDFAQKLIDYRALTAPNKDIAAAPGAQLYIRVWYRAAAGPWSEPSNIASVATPAAPPAGAVIADGTVHSMTIGKNAEWPLSGGMMLHPAGIAVDPDGNVWTSDDGLNRVVKYEPPFAEGMDAFLVLGQEHLGGGGPYHTLNRMRTPRQISFNSDGVLFVNDDGNGRVLVFNPPFYTNKPADATLIPPGNMEVVASNSPDGSIFVSGYTWIAKFSPPFGFDQQPDLVRQDVSFRGLAMSPGGTELYAGTGGSISRLDPATLATIDSVSIPVGGNDDLRFDPAGNLWAVTSGQPIVGYATPLHQGMQPLAVVPTFFEPAIAFDSEGNLWSASYAAKRHSPSAVFDAAATSMTVTWAANGNPVSTEYEVQLATSPDFGGVLSAPPITTGTSEWITGLQPDTVYHARGRARIGQGAWSAYRDLGSGKTTTADIKRIVWTGGGSDGLWHNPQNWDKGTFPGPFDDAVIDTAVSIDATAAPIAFSHLVIGPGAVAVASISQGSSITVHADGLFTQHGKETLTVTEDILIESGGRFTHADNVKTFDHHLSLFAGGDFILETGGVIDADALGYDGDTVGNSAGAGPGGGKKDGNRGGAGGGHGGNGGSARWRTAGGYYWAQGGDQYDDLLAPSEPGSGGAQAYGGAGGGVVLIEAGGRVAIGGVVSADGASGRAHPQGTPCCGGGGAGGSIRISAGEVAGVGTLNANGGDGYVFSGGDGYEGGGGSGGRISITGAGAKSAGLTLLAGPGASGGGFSQRGGAGTIVRRVTGEDPDVIVAASFAQEEFQHAKTTLPTPLSADRLVILNARVEGSGAPKNISASSMTLAGAYQVTLGTLTFPTAGLAGFTVPPKSTLAVVNMSHDPSWDWAIEGDFRILSKLEARSVDLRGTMAASELNASANLNIGPQGILKQQPNVLAGLRVTVGGDMSLAAGGRIDAVGRGYGPGQGPGASAYVKFGGTGGAGHGGVGGLGEDGGMGPFTGGTAYGSLFNPLLPGSGAGGTRPGPGGPGGGVVVVDVTGALDLNGDIDASGGSGISHVGGGSGGSINITAGSITGAGTLLSRGGDGAAPGGGGGAGGRIAVVASGIHLAQLVTDTGGGIGTLGDSPDANLQAQNGGGGTANLKDPAQSGYRLRVGGPSPLPPDGRHAPTPFTEALVVDAFTVVDADPTAGGFPLTITQGPPVLHGAVSFGFGTLSFPAPGGFFLDIKEGASVGVDEIIITDGRPLDIQADGTLAYRGVLNARDLTGTGSMYLSTASLTGAVTLGADARLYVSSISAGGDFTAGAGSVVTLPPGKSGVLHLSAGGDFLLASGALLDLKGRGYPRGRGPGAGGANFYSAGGGGYGGRGGDGHVTPGQGAPGGAAYGSAENPVDAGSGGGSGLSGRGGAGGGAVFRVGGGFVIDGTIDASGSTDHRNFLSGGGSGGSINLCGSIQLSGSGVLRADGGNGRGTHYQGGRGGGGGGGRICAPVGTFLGTLTASGGSGYAGGQNGEDGTIHRLAAVVASADSVAEMTSFSPTGTVTEISTTSETQAFTAAEEDNLVAVIPFYEVEVGTSVLEEYPIITFTFDPTNIDTATLAIFRYDGAVWSSAPVINQSFTLLASNLGELTGTLLTTSLFGVFFEQPDRLAPRTSLIVGAPKHIQGDTVFITSRTLLALAAEDDKTQVGDNDGVGVERSEYALDAGAFGIYGAGFTLLSQGTHTVRYFSVDEVGNEEAVRIAAVAVDNTPPAASVALTGPRFTAPPDDPLAVGGPLFITSHTLLTLSAQDLPATAAASGVGRIETGLGAAPLTSYSAAFAIAAEGPHALKYRALDRVGNAGTLKAFSVSVDSTPPATVVAYEGAHFAAFPGSGAVPAETQVFLASATRLVLSAADPVSQQAASGLGEVRYRVSSGPWLAYGGAFTLPTTGQLVLERSATDRVGNEEPVRSLRAARDDAPTISTLTVGSPRVLRGGELIVSATTPFTIGTVDPAVGGVAAGVAGTFFRVWDSTTPPDFESYAGVFRLSGEGGPRTVEFFGKDRVRNTEAVRSRAVVLDAEAPLLALASPSPDAAGICRVFGGNVPVLGSIADAHLGAWRLEYAPGRQASATFVFISSGAQGARGMLGVWDTSALSGYYTLRLAAVDAVGNAAELTAEVYVGEPARLVVLGDKKTFKQPESLAAGTGGKIYVADTHKDRVRVFGPGGGLLATFGGKHGGDDDDDDRRRSKGLDLNKPKDVEVDAAGNIFVADTRHHRIVKLSPDGKTLLELGNVRIKKGKRKFRSGDDPGEFKDPEGVALSPAGDIYVADTGNRRVQVFNPDGTFLREFPVPPVAEGKDKHDHDDDDDKADDDDDDREHKKSKAGKPAAIAVDAAGNVYLADSEGRRALKLGPDGSLLLSIGRKGKGPGEFKRPSGIAVSPGGGCILVADRDLNRIQKFDSGGNLTLAFGEKGKTKDKKPLPARLVFKKPMGLALDPEGRLLVADRDNDRVQIFGLPGSEVLVVSADTGKDKRRGLGTSAVASLAPMGAVDPRFVFRNAYAYPNPAVRGAEPKIHIAVGIADKVTVRIYDLAGRLVDEGTMWGMPGVVDDGSGSQYAYEYVWRGHIPSGVYLYTIDARKSGKPAIRKAGKLAVVR